MKLGDSSTPPAHALIARGIFVRSRSSNYSFCSLSNHNLPHPPLEKLTVSERKSIFFHSAANQLLFQPSEGLANPLHPLSTLTADAWPTPIKPRLIKGSLPFGHQTVLLISTAGVSALREGPLGAIDQTLSYARQTSHQCQVFFSLSGFTIL